MPTLFAVETGREERKMTAEWLSNLNTKSTAKTVISYTIDKYIVLLVSPKTYTLRSKENPVL